MTPTVRRPVLLVALAAAAGAALVAGTDALRADEPAPPGAKPDAPQKDAKAPAATPRIERARQLVKDLEETLVVLKAAQADAGTIRALERALEEARKLAKPITVAEMTEEERRSVAEELKKLDGGGDAPAGGGAPAPDAWLQRTLDGAFKDVELTSDETDAATKIISEWQPKALGAWTKRDSKAQSDLKTERDEKLEKALGKKKAQKVINNLNAMVPGRGGR